MTPNQPPTSPEERRKSGIRTFAKYSGMAFQFLAACLLGVFLGRWLDARIGNQRPLFAVFLTIFFMLGAFYSVYRQLLRDSK